MADQKIELEIVLDDGSIKRAFGTIRNEAKDTETSIASAFKIRGFTDFVAAIYSVNAALGVVKQTADSLINTVLSGEKLDAINRRFDELAKRQGLNAEALRSGIESATAGTVSIEDALRSTSNSLVNLQANLNDIPKLFEIAKKSAALFGGDTIANFEAIQQAIISGNTRSLRELGIFIDASKTINTFEKSVNAIPGGLSEAGRQQALLNEVLKVSAERFKGVNSEITPLDQSIKRFGVSFGNVADTVSTASNKAFGPSLVQFFKNSALALDSFNIKIGEFLLGKAPTAAENVKVLTFQIQELSKSLTMAQVRGDIDRVEQINSEIAALRERLLVEQESANQKTINDQATLNSNAINRESLVITQQLTQSAIDGRLALEEYTKLQEDAANKAKLAADSVNQAVKNAIVNGIAQGVLSMTNALLKGQNVLSAFGKTILGIFGDLAIQTGTILIGIGIGLESLKLLNGLQAVAAGIGLVAIGGVLKALSGGEATLASIPAGGGVAGIGQTQDLGLQQSPQQAIREQPVTQVNLTVQGDILDSDTTGSRIVQLLNDAIDTKGAVVRGLA